ncbi:TPA: hypothetical protein WI168_001807 [Neisseria meningitidis]
MNEYTFSYRFNGKSWSLSIWADNPEEARAKFRAARENAQYDGEVVAKPRTRTRAVCHSCFRPVG